MVKIDYRDGRPIYEQVADGIEELALRGALPAETQLPSVRQFAMELSINPNTIQKAYTILESEGVILTLPGRGSVVLSETEDLRQKQLAKMEEKLSVIAAEAHSTGIAEEEFVTAAHRAWQRTDSKREGGESE